MRLFGYSLLEPRVLLLATITLTTACLVSYFSIPSLRDSTNPKIILEKFENLTWNSVNRAEILQADALESDEIPSLPVQHLHFVIISCIVLEKRKIHIRSEWSHQMKQTKVMLKSLAYLSSSIIHINIITNSRESYNDIVSIPQSWPQKYRDRFVFEEQRQVYYPEGLGIAKLEEKFAPCCNQKLFLHHILKDLDAVAFVDSDTIFMQAPEKYWQHFQNFEKRQVMGVTPCLYMYDTDRKSMPKYSWTGINTGTLLVNLTRIRQFPGGWNERVKDIIKTERHEIQLPDQDMINMIFSKNYTGLAYEVGCEWNFRLHVCSKERNRCPNAASKGVGILHGCATTFVNSEAPRFKAVFEAWEKFELGSSDKDLLDTLEVHVRNVSHVKRGCYRLSNIEDILLKGLKDELRDKEVEHKRCN